MADEESSLSRGPPAVRTTGGPRLRVCKALYQIHNFAGADQISSLKMHVGGENAFFSRGKVRYAIVFGKQLRPGRVARIPSLLDIVHP